MIKTLSDVVITLVLWTYFIVGYVCVFSPIYIGAFLFAKNRENAFQSLNCLFFKGFFFLLRAITPGITFKIDQDIRSIRSAVIVCNHRSYLDPILLISLFKKHKTIVKSVFFKVPIFGWVLKTAGYIPSSTGESFTSMMIERVETIQPYIASGGNLFIFPEGTRSAGGVIAPFGKGAFTIANHCKAPIKVLFIRNTDKLFQPGKFLFNTMVENTIQVELLATLNQSRLSSVSELMKEVRALLEAQNGRHHG